MPLGIITITTHRVIVNNAFMRFSKNMDDPTGHSVFATRLKAAREASGLTQQVVAELIGISQRTYAAYEGGDKVPMLERLPKVAEALGVSVGALFDSHAPPRAKSPTHILASIRRELTALETQLCGPGKDESQELTELRAEVRDLREQLIAAGLAPLPRRERRA